MTQLCNTCSTPIDASGRCVTCDAVAEGLRPIGQSGFASIREMMSLLEGQGLSPEMETVPPRREEEKAHPLWNLYVPEAEVARAREFLRKDWAELLGDPDAAAAAARGEVDIDLEKGGEVDCPACGHRFTLSASAPECPECGLSLGVPANAAPDETTTS
ncbi:MAG TPA: hypothetical protein VLU43_01705 [Anaeromyxobacteraceae bacterium]|nr:hypothetical protein [Anaeromyxobacteraceae bacterium]